MWFIRAYDPYLLNVAIIEDDFDPPPITSTAFAITEWTRFRFASIPMGCVTQPVHDRLR